jgi:methionyl-tRNA synthetase
VSRVVNMVHKYFGGVVPEAGAETAAETALRESAVNDRRLRAEFDEMNFSEALKALWAWWRRPTAT